jgi:tRNA dimethylallyltransferase
MTSEPVIAVVGATGTGKSDLALDLAEALDGEIINTDSMQFYRGMDIGTAKLPLGERRGIPHHLLDILDVPDEASVARFQAEVRSIMDGLHAAGRRAILVGGSGLYVRAALDVLEFPPTDPAVRERLEAWAAADGIGAVADRLHAVDPESASRLKDSRRIIRALEVHEISGRTFTSYMPQREYARPAIQVGLSLPREVLHERLARRVDLMMEQGLLDEVRGLIPRGLRDAKTASRAIGYRQALDVLDGRMTERDAAESTVIATRQFARRQETWFRADPRVAWFAADEPATADRVLSHLRREGDSA